MIKLSRSNALLLLVLIIVFQANKVFAQSMEKRIDSVILTEFKDPKGPGGVFMVAQKGKVIYQKAFISSSH